MENRFGLRDLILAVLLIGVIVTVWLSIAAGDRLYRQFEIVNARLQSQATDLQRIQEALARGVATIPGVGPTTESTTQPAAAIDSPQGPFKRILAARNLPGFARGGWMIDAFGNNVGKLTPLLSTDAYASAVQAYVLESLADRDPDTLEWRPVLASGWTLDDHSADRAAYVKSQKAAGKTDEQIAADPAAPPALRITFKMRPQPLFSDGSPLTADDVVFTFNFIMDPRINAPRDRAYVSRISKVEKTAPDEVAFTFNEPYFEAFELAAGLPVLSKNFYSQFPPADFNQSVGYLLGSGPYRLRDPKTWKPGTPIELVRNDRYWGVQPAFDRLSWREISNDAAHLAGFRNGDIDLFPATPEQYKQMIADADLVARTQHFEYQNPVGGYRYIAWNQKRSGQPTRFADARVRQALTLLIDRQRMIQEIMLGYAVPATGPFNPLSKQSNPEVQPWPLDVARAQKLLADAGYTRNPKDNVLYDVAGQPFSFKLTYPSGSANYEKMVLFLKDAYARAGIVLQPDPLDWAVLVERLNDKNFDAVTLAWTAGIEGDIYQMFDSSQSGPGGDNFVAYANPDLDAAIRSARTTIDETARMKRWRTAHAILHEDQPYTFLFFPKSLVFVDQRIQNVLVTKLGLNNRVEWFVPANRQRLAP